MNHHVITALLLVAALVAYGIGFHKGGTAIFILGLGLECWFWVRLSRSVRVKDKPDQSPAKSSVAGTW
jgi:hypothetical protein